MKLYGTFHDINENIITVIFYNKNSIADDINIDTCNWIRFSGDEPVIISTDIDTSFEHIIKKSCTINLLSKRWLGDYLFADNATSIVVNVIRTINNTSKCLFAGFVTPNTYNQDYSHEWEVITINCNDNLGTMEYRNQNDEMTWEQLNADSQMRTFEYLLERTKIDDPTIVINNMPDTQQNSELIWIETGYDRIVNDDGTIDYYIVKTKSKTLDSNTAVTTPNVELGTTPLPVTYIQSNDVVIQDGILYYKRYAHIEVNGEDVNTGDYIIGDEATELMPYVVDTVNVLDGWTYGAHMMPFEYYEHYRVDHVMSDGAVKRGDSDAIGYEIPMTPLATPNDSYYELRQGDATDYIEINGVHYYKNYAWIVMIIDGVTREYKPGDWEQGDEIN